MNAGLDPITLRKIALQILILLGLLFGAVAWNQKPEAALLWLTGMLTLPAAWALVAFAVLFTVFAVIRIRNRGGTG